MRVFVYILDGCTLTRLGKLIDDGKIPFFSKLKAEGSGGIGKSVFPPASCPAVPCIYTGKNIGKIGLRDSFTPAGKLSSSQDIKAKSIWEYLGDRGLRSCVLNVGMTYPPKPFNGVLFTGYETPGPDVTYSYPASYQQKYDWALVDYTKIGKDSALSKEEKYTYLQEWENKRFAVFDKLLHDEKFDFAMFHVQGTDTVKHFFWNEDEPIINFYNHIFNHIEDINNKHKPDVTFFISDHGFEAVPKYQFNIFAWLRQEGYFKTARGMTFLARTVYPIVKKFKVARKAVRKAHKISSEKDKLVGVNWKATKAYTLLVKPIGIYLTAEEGTEEYLTLRQEIVEKLKKLTFEGKPVIKDIHFKHEVFSGPYVKDLPDIVFLTHNFAKDTNIYGKKLFTKNPNQQVQGKHINERDGIFFAIGKGIKKGLQRDVSILDLAPTVLHAYNLPIPEDLDGEVLVDIFEKSSPLSKPPKKESEGKKLLDATLQNIKL